MTAVRESVSGDPSHTLSTPTSHLSNLVLGRVNTALSLHKHSTRFSVQQLRQNESVAKCPQEGARVVKVGVTSDHSEPQVSEKGEQSSSCDGECSDKHGVSSVCGVV